MSKTSRKEKDSVAEANRKLRESQGLSESDVLGQLEARGLQNVGADMREDVVVPSPPFSGKLSDDAIRLLVDIKNYTPGPERILVQLFSRSAAFAKKPIEFDNPESEVVDVKVLSEVQQYGYFLKGLPGTMKRLKEEHGLELEYGDMLILRRGAGDFFEVAQTSYAEFYPLDIVALVK